MQDQSNTKKELLQELVSMKKGSAELEHSEIERKRIEDALQESEEKFRFIVDNSMMPMIISSLKDYTVIFYNIFASEFFSDTSLPGTVKASDYWVRPFERDIFIGKLKEKGSVKEYEAELRTAAGEHKWCLLSAKIINYLGDPASFVMFNDITELKHAEEALQRSETKFRTLYESTSDAVMLLNENGILDCNRKTLAIFGCATREEFCQKKIADLSPPQQPCGTDSKVLAQQMIATALKKGSINFEWMHTRNDTCKTFPADVLLTAMELDGKPVVQAVTRDISARKEAEAYKEKMEAQNRQLQKSESLGRMAAAIAHHFNNQLGVVIGNLEMVMDKLPQRARLRENITSAMAASTKAAEMSGMMLTYLGQSFDKRESLYLSDTCLWSLPLLQATMPSNVVLETDFPSPGPVISADANQMQQVLTNLVTNARDAVGEDHGTIHMSVKTVSPAEIPSANRSPIGWQPQGNAYACLEVTDTGVGIAEKDIEKLFDPFFSTKFTGRGMGLAVVLGIVRTHKGVATVGSQQGRGCTFRVFFPVSAEEVLPQPDKVAKVQAFEEGGTVLLIEDEEMVRNMAAAMLKRIGYSVLEAKDGVEALEVFRQHRDEIICVLTDLTMPHMNGWETLTALRKLAPDFPVILASGYDEAHVMQGDHPDLPQVFLGKPYKLKGLRDAIGQALINKK